MTIEKTTYSELMASIFEEVRRQTFVQPRMIKIGGRSQEVKDMRIEAAEPRWRAGEIYFVQSLRDQHRKWNPMFEAMVKWPFVTHDDVPDAISDLDKRDESHPGHPVFHCPGPPVGWASQPVRPIQQPIINGQFNPNYGYPAREHTKANQGRHDLWRTSSSTMQQSPQTPTQPDLGSSIFQQPPPPPMPWE
jgi:hypothetical protein